MPNRGIAMGALAIRRTALLTATPVAFGGGSVVLAWAGAPALAAVRAGSPSLDASVGIVAVAVAWVVLAWLGASVLLACLAATPALLGDVAWSLSQRLGPPALRRLVWLVLGVTAASLPGTPALAADGGERVATTRPAASTAPAPPAPLPLLDRPARPAAPDRETPAPAATPPPAPSQRPWTPPSPRDRTERVDHPSAALVSGGSRTTEPDAEVVVRRGDTLWHIAARHLAPGASIEEIARAWPRWYAANRQVIGDDPDLLLPGQRLRHPA